MAGSVQFDPGNFAEHPMTSPSSPSSTVPRWMRGCLLAAGVYNLSWGFFVVVYPHALFDWTGTERLNHPEIWQCVGMIVGVYGIGYLLASRDPVAHWPIVLVGLLGKLFGPLGFLVSWTRGQLPGAWAWVILMNDLLWWGPFVAILAQVARGHLVSMPRRRFVWESRIAAPPEVVFRFHEQPDALARLIPPWERVTVLVPPTSLEVGTRVVLENRLGPFRLRWVAVHEEYDPPHRFADRQESGPFAFWYHRHHVLDDGRGGTILRDEVEYALPGGALSEWLFGNWVRSKLERLFAYRHETTRSLIETGACREVNSANHATV